MPFSQQMLFFIVLILMMNSVCGFTNNILSTTTIPSRADEIANEIRRIEKELKEVEEKLEMDREKLREDKQIINLINNTDIFKLNIGGEIIPTTRQTLTKIPKSILSLMFNGRWEHKLQRDQDGNIFLDFNPIVFRHLLDQLQVHDTNTPIYFYPPSQPAFVQPFNKMIKKLGLQQMLSSDKKNIITFNVGGKIITNQRTTFTQVSNSTFDTIVSPSKIRNFNNESDVFVDYDPKVFRYLIKQLRKQSFKNISYLELSSYDERIAFETMLIDLSIYRQTLSFSQISINTKWKQNGLTIAGGNGRGNKTSQLERPYGIYVDDDNQCIYIADYVNHRIVEWKFGAKIGRVVAGNTGEGNRTDQLNRPTDVIVDKTTNSLIICDRDNKRVVRWSRQDSTNAETIISAIDCNGLMMDNIGDLYVSDWKKDEVRRWKIGETNGIIVAGGHGKGNNLNQLNVPTYVFVDKEYSVYVSDWKNHRVMKWVKGAKEGIVVAGGQAQGNSSTQLNYSWGVIVDHLGQVYVADTGNHRIICWPKGSKEGRIIFGGNGRGEQANQLQSPEGLSFDPQGNIYIVDTGNDRVQKIEIIVN